MKSKSIYKYAAEAGLPIGLYLTMMSACLLLSIKIAALPMLLFPLALGFPFVLWAVMKKISRLEPSYNKFSSLWLSGIYSVIFGTLICMFLSSAYIVFFEPSFVGKYFTNALETLESSPMAEQYSSQITLMHDVVDAHLLPSGLEFLTTIAWLTCFCGSILSLLIALLMSRNGNKVTKRMPV